MKWKNNLDFDYMTLTISDFFSPNDAPIFIHYTHTDWRDAINMRKGSKDGSYGDPYT